MLDTFLQRFGCLRIVHVHVPLPMHACRPMTILNEFISIRRQPQHRDALAQKSILWMLRSIPKRTTLFQTEVTSNKNEIKYKLTLYPLPSKLLLLREVLRQPDYQAHALHARTLERSRPKVLRLVCLLERSV